MWCYAWATSLWAGRSNSVHWVLSRNPTEKDRPMKTLTIAKAAKELNALASQRLNTTPADGFLKMRLEQFTSAVDAAITELQGEVQRMHRELEELKKRAP